MASIRVQEIKCHNYIEHSITCSVSLQNFTVIFICDLKSLTQSYFTNADSVQIAICGLDGKKKGTARDCSDCSIVLLQLFF